MQKKEKFTEATLQSFILSNIAYNMDIQKLVKKIEEADEEKAKILSEVLLGQALLQEGIMPSDPVAFALNLRKAMEA